MWLELDDIGVDCIIGDLPDERNRTQHLRVDLRLELPDDAADTDALEDTVDYVELTEAVRRSLVEAKCRLIERAARLAAETAMSDQRVRAVEAKVLKSGIVPGLASASVIFKLERHA